MHVSQLADRFVKDPREVVKAGDIVKVKVLEVDARRRRISLTMKLQDAAARSQRPAPSTARPKEPQSPASPATSMAAAFSRLRN